MTNIDRARDVIAQAASRGVDEFCVCSGSRNSPLLAVLGVSGARLFSFVDERSAAFFALGRIKQRRRPVAVVTTSGTAVAELLPATIEAYYSSLPLMLITADRPARFRGTGAPQCIEQEAIFGPYASRSFEAWDESSPMHINIEFDDPLIDAAIEGPEALTAERERTGEIARAKPLRPCGDPSSAMKRPIVILAALDAADRDRVRDFALKLNAPIYAEALSGLREDPALRPLVIASGERMIGRGNFDGVIRIGGVPTLRFWRDLEETHRDLPVVSFGRARFAGLTRGELHSIDELPEPRAGERDEAFFTQDAAMSRELAKILDEEPQSEPAMFRDLSRTLPDGVRIYLGNSLPIREWDLFAERESRRFAYEANRGANGIDGQLSTFFGWCAPEADNVAIIGDLTAMYDMNAPWIRSQLDDEIRLRIVIVNNGGGRIFSRVPSLKKMDADVRECIVENAHTFRFGMWAAMWGLQDVLVEKVPDRESTQRVWQRYDELWS